MAISICLRDSIAIGPVWPSVPSFGGSPWQVPQNTVKGKVEDGKADAEPDNRDDCRDQAGQIGVAQKEEAERERGNRRCTYREIGSKAKCGAQFDAPAP